MRTFLRDFAYRLGWNFIWAGAGYIILPFLMPTEVFI